MIGAIDRHRSIVRRRITSAGQAALVTLRYLEVVISYGSCSSLVRHEAYCYIARKAGRDERRLSLDLMPNRNPKG
jgi:hypothetical protein